MRPGPRGSEGRHLSEVANTTRFLHTHLVPPRAGNSRTPLSRKADEIAARHAGRVLGLLRAAAALDGGRDGLLLLFVILPHSRIEVHEFM